MELTTILVVEDETLLCNDIVGELQEAGFKATGAANGVEALKILEQGGVDLVLCDISMPEMDGYQLLEKIRKGPSKYSGIVFIFLTAITDRKKIIEGKNLGADDYLTKPIDYDLLIATVRAHINQSQRILKLQEEGPLKDTFVVRASRAIKEPENTLDTVFLQTIEAMVRAMEIRDPYTAGHQKRVSKLSAAIGGIMGLDEKTVCGAEMGAMIHDVGKIAIPSELLVRPGKLSEPQFNLIMTHPEAGWEIVKGIEFPWPVADIVRQHHERFDGTGYPDGLAGEDILLESRIVAVADVIDAMGSDRPYRHALAVGETMREIQAKRGTLFDPQVVDAAQELFSGTTQIEDAAGLV